MKYLIKQFICLCAAVVVMAVSSVVVSTVAHAQEPIMMWIITEYETGPEAQAMGWVPRCPTPQEMQISIDRKGGIAANQQLTCGDKVILDGPHIIGLGI